MKIFLLFFMFGLLLYGNSFNNKFVIDDYFFSSNPVKSDVEYIFHQWPLHRDRASGFLANSVWFNRPLAYLALDLYFAAGKNNLWAFHLFNIFLFALVASFICFFVEKIARNYSLAFLTGFFFLIHPINGIMVNNISSGYYSVVILLMLGSVTLLLESLEKNNDRILYFLSLLLSFISLFWHEIGMMAPLYISSAIVLFRKDMFRTKAIYLFPYFLIVFFYVLFRTFFFAPDQGVLKVMALYHMTSGTYLATMFKVYSWFISKMIYPQGIVMLWAQPILHDHAILDIFGLCSLAMLFLFLFIKLSKEIIGQIALAWILIGFAPACLAAFRTPQYGVIIEPHWFIFSSIGFFLLISYFCLALLARMKLAGLVILFIIIFFWGSFTYAYNRMWKDQITYALYWSQQNPYLKKTYDYLAEAYQRKGDIIDSGKYYRLGLTGDLSVDEMNYISLENIDIAEGRLKDAEQDCKMVLGIDPYNAGTYDNLGAIYYAKHRLDIAREFLERSLTLDPHLTQPRIGLASIFLKRHEYQKAIDLCLKNLSLVKDDSETLFFLMDIYAGQKDIVHLQKYAYLMIHDNTDPVVLTKLGNKMAQMNMKSIALDSYKKAIELVPDYKDAYLGAGKIFAESGQYDEAVHIWKLGGIKN